MKNTNPIVFGILVIALIITLMFFISFINSEAQECLSGPVGYGMSKIGTGVKCNCEIRDGRTFNINDTDMWWVEESRPIILNINKP